MRFYSPDIKETLSLPEAESFHCIRVMRLGTGDKLQVVDGKGHLFDCRIINANPKSTGIEIIDEISENPHWRCSVTLAVAPTKNIDRIEWLAEKAVEIGVDRLVFLDCTRNVRKTVKRERIMKIMVSAMKQSLKSRLPIFDEYISLREFIETDTNAVRVMGYCDDSIPRTEFARFYDGHQSLTIMIGPEGDFTPVEVELAGHYGFVPVTFGNTRLRTETAAVYALCAAHTIMSL